MVKRLFNEKGVTLLETLAVAAIVAVAIISIYISIIYADKQLQRNYHDRVAHLYASGEIDWQMYYKKNFKQFDLFTNRPVILDNLVKGKQLIGSMTAAIRETYESMSGTVVPYTILEVVVIWQEPGDKSARKIVIREDFY